MILNKENSDLLCETDGLKKVVDINTKPGYQQKLRKAAGQVIKGFRRLLYKIDIYSISKSNF